MSIWKWTHRIRPTSSIRWTQRSSRITNRLQAHLQKHQVPTSTTRKELKINSKDWMKFCNWKLQNNVIRDSVTFQWILLMNLMNLPNNLRMRRSRISKLWYSRRSNTRVTMAILFFSRSASNMSSRSQSSRSNCSKVKVWTINFTNSTMKINPFKSKSMTWAPKMMEIQA